LFCSSHSDTLIILKCDERELFRASSSFVGYKAKRIRLLNAYSIILRYSAIAVRYPDSVSNNTVM